MFDSSEHVERFLFTYSGHLRAYKIPQNSYFGGSPVCYHVKHNKLYICHIRYNTVTEIFTFYSFASYNLDLIY